MTPEHLSKNIPQRTDNCPSGTDPAKARAAFLSDIDFRELCAIIPQSQERPAVQVPVTNP